mmetsp:Transcript_28873/g.50613  ORF Transcript_28873/g.50613 Transcript_28873/m.50613 type:complete len:147 (-) Transcript_28873:39-479(-)
MNNRVIIPHSLAGGEKGLSYIMIHVAIYFPNNQLDMIQLATHRSANDAVCSNKQMRRRRAATPNVVEQTTYAMAHNQSLLRHPAALLRLYTQRTLESTISSSLQARREGRRQGTSRSFDRATRRYNPRGIHASMAVAVHGHQPVKE